MSAAIDGAGALTAAMATARLRRQGIVSPTHVHVVTSSVVIPTGGLAARAISSGVDATDGTARSQDRA